jgi:CDP-paratose synthetase
VKTVVITGANGFLGSHLVSELYPDHRVVACIRSDRRDERVRHLHRSIVVVTLSETTPEEIVDMYDPDAVVHAAVEYGYKNDSVAIQAVNIEMATQFAHALSQKRAESHRGQFVYVDSFFSKFPEYQHLSSYTQSKRDAVTQLSSIAADLPVVSLRLEHLYGPRDGVQKVIPSIARQLIENVSPLLLTAGEQQRDFVHILDAVKAFRSILSNPQAGFTAHDVGTGESTAMRTVFTTMKALSGSTSELQFGALPYRPGEPMNSTADVSSLRQLGYDPVVSLETGLLSVIRYLRDAG